MISAQIVDEIQTKAQRLLTERLARQEGLHVVPFDETRRILADIAPSGKPFTEAQAQALGNQTGADIVLTGVIHNYGCVRALTTGSFLHHGGAMRDSRRHQVPLL